VSEGTKLPPAVSGALEALGMGQDHPVTRTVVPALLRGNHAVLAAPPAPGADEALADAIERRRRFLVDYQDETLAQRYLALIGRVRDAEAALDADSTALSHAAARAYFKLLAYKDEYEVARLHTASGFLEQLRRDFGPRAKIRFHLAPPLMNRKRDARGRPRKREFGAWILPFLRLLARLRRLRGTRLDPFGLSAERRLERALITEFESTLASVLAGLHAANLGEATSIVNLYMEIRGYGPVKEEAVASVRKRVDDRLRAFNGVTHKAA